MGGDLGPEGTFILFGVFCVLGAFFVGIFVKETRGLNDIEKKSVYFKNSIKP